MPEATTTKKMISPKIVEALSDTQYRWVIKLEVKGKPNTFTKEFSFNGSFPQAEMAGERAVESCIVKIGKILLMRGDEISS